MGTVRLPADADEALSAIRNWNPEAEVVYPGRAFDRPESALDRRWSPAEILLALLRAPAVYRDDERAEQIMRAYVLQAGIDRYKIERGWV